MKPSRNLFASILLIAAIAIQAILAPAPVSAQPPVPLAPIDLVLDADADGLPDELVAAVEQIQANALSDNPAVANAAALDAAIMQLYERLPYAPYTRHLQTKLADYTSQLANVSSSADSEALAAKLSAAQAEMLKDPAYATTKHTLEALAQKTLLANTQSPQGVDRLFLPSLDNGRAGDLAHQVTVDTLPNPWPEGEPLWGALAPGDIVFVRGPEDRPIWQLLKLFTLWFEHAGTFGVGPDGVPMMLDSRVDLMIPQAGVAARPLHGWLQAGDKVALGRVIAVPPDSVALALIAGATKIGSPFNFNILDKETSQKFYCAQLIYWMYHSTSGVNLDSNDPLYRLYLTLVWGKWLGPLIAQKSIGVDELWLGTNNIVIYNAGTVGVDSPILLASAPRP